MSWEIQQDQNNQLTCLQKKIFITRGTVLTVLLKTGTNILGKKLFKGRFCWAYICRAYSEALFSEGGGGVYYWRGCCVTRAQILTKGRYATLTCVC